MGEWTRGALVSGVLAFAAIQSAAAIVEHRCGWIENPTPDNW